MSWMDSMRGLKRQKICSTPTSLMTDLTRIVGSAGLRLTARRTPVKVTGCLLTVVLEGLYVTLIKEPVPMRFGDFLSNSDQRAKCGSESLRESSRNC